MANALSCFAYVLAYLQNLLAYLVPRQQRVALVSDLGRWREVGPEGSVHVGRDTDRVDDHEDERGGGAHGGAAGHLIHIHTYV